jgi:arylsulfatase A-like enzyme
VSLARSASTCLTRRDMMRAGGLALAGWASALSTPIAGGRADPPPNILWIVSEDNGPFLGAYGDPLARTPTLDRLARDGVLFENCFSQAPVCAPSRFALITGMYPTSCPPANHMRAQGHLPPGLRGFPAYLREAGYYCTNNAKTDYNAPIDIEDTWDESSRQAHWRKRPQERTFFSVFNHEVTHEGQLFPEARARYRPLEVPTDPARVRLPPYHPDAPEFRSDWAGYYDHLARLDGQVADLLKQLREDGLDEQTIVFYYSDNGGVLPRSKRFAYDSGLHVPLIVRFPDRYRHLAPASAGGRVTAPVSFVDFAPTVLSLAGVRAPRHFQGSAFAGAAKGPERDYAFSFRDRMDERYDMVRTARDRRYRYVRNYMPHRIYGQHVDYMFQMPSVQAWERMNRQGKLGGAQAAFWGAKPAEELYDIQADPFEVHNLARAAAHQSTLKRMRTALRQHLLATEDGGFIPEGSPLEARDGAGGTARYPLGRIIDMADLAIERAPANLARLQHAVQDPNECIRYWATLGCLMLSGKAARATASLEARLKDDSNAVRIVAAEALCHLGEPEAALPALRDGLASSNPRTRLQAVNALQYIGKLASPLIDAIGKARDDGDEYVKRAASYLFETLQA